MSSLKPSLIAKVERSYGDAEHHLEEVTTEDTIDEDFAQFFVAKQNELPPLTRCSTDEFNEAMGINEDGPSVDMESVLKSSKYTGFTIALKEEKEGPPQLRLSRGPLIENLKTLLVVDKDDQKAKEVEPLDLFSNTKVIRATALDPDPYAEADEVWAGLEVITRKGDEDLNYCLMSHGYSEWKVFDQSEESKDQSDSWQVESAEIVRVKEKGPYIRLSIDEKHSVFFYPISPNLPLQRMHRFLTR